jgi:hypothetical protein
VDVAFVGHWGLASEPQEFVPPEFARELERENAALREVFAKAELLSDPAVAEGDYEYVEFCGYFRPNEIIVVMDRAALDAARAKGGQAMSDSDDVTIESLKNDRERLLKAISKFRHECSKLRVALKDASAALAGIKVYAGNKPKLPWVGDCPELATIDGIRKYAAEEHKKTVDALKAEEWWL